MKILLVEKDKFTRPLYLFLDTISEGLCIKIINKFQSYVQHGNLYHCKQLKALNSKIWKYKGTIYKLRVDNANESARVLFAKTKQGNLKIIHAFLKSTQKTPKKDARQAISIYQNLDSFKSIVCNEQSMNC
ncbi:MAG: type II toxin-antitoxin system RelE/ParE family toxin [Gammaproteobacteria bacterium]|nr:type II toxin-antitoxin system RelE/ParE family toxin [Gammaproteobacteria bacterium]